MNEWFAQKNKRFANLLICHERPEGFAHGRSLNMRNLSDSPTVAHLSWAIWGNRSQSLIWFEWYEQMSEWAMSKLVNWIPSPAFQIDQHSTRLKQEFPVAPFVLDVNFFRSKYVCYTYNQMLEMYHVFNSAREGHCFLSFWQCRHVCPSFLTVYSILNFCLAKPRRPWVLHS